MADEPGVIEMYVPEAITFDSTDATWVVLHKTAGFHTAQECAAYFQAGSDGNNVSAHYVVGLSGTIVQCVPESRGAGANCCLKGNYAPYLPTGVNLNIKTISIEHIDPATDNSTPLTDAQKQASFTLVKHICERHNIPQRSGDADGGIIGHNDIDTINRARCPGNYPRDELFAFLAQGGATAVKHIIPDAHMLQAAQDEWNSFFKNALGKNPPPIGSGIYKSWQSRLFDEGRHIGPPITWEYDSVDWNGNKIVVQQFADGRCEWNGQANWYSTDGQF